MVVVPVGAQHLLEPLRATHARDKSRLRPAERLLSPNSRASTSSAAAVADECAVRAAWVARLVKLPVDCPREESLARRGSEELSGPLKILWERLRARRTRVIAVDSLFPSKRQGPA